MTANEYLKSIQDNFDGIEKNLKEIEEPSDMLSAEEIAKAFDVAFRALEQELCEDAVSKQAVLDLLENTNNGWIINEVNQLPSIQPVTGKWIPVSERLPKVEQYALITVHNQTKMCWYQNGVFVDGEQNAYTKENEELVAWMPLPEPYKEVKE